MIDHMVDMTSDEYPKLRTRAQDADVMFGTKWSEFPTAPNSSPKHSDPVQRNPSDHMIYVI